MFENLIAFLLVLAPLQAQTSQLPAAFPREGAKQLIDNERVTVWDVTQEKGKATPMHQHKYDAVGVDLADATVKVTSSDGKTSSQTIRLGQVFSLKKGKAEVQEGTSDKPRHAIVIDLKDVVVPPIPNKSGY